MNKLIGMNAIIITEENIEAFDEFLNNFEELFSQKKENIKNETIDVITKLIKTYDEQVIKGLKYGEK